MHTRLCREKREKTRRMRARETTVTPRAPGAIGQQARQQRADTPHLNANRRRALLNGATRARRWLSKGLRDATRGSIIP